MRVFEVCNTEKYKEKKRYINVIECNGEKYAIYTVECLWGEYRYTGITKINTYDYAYKNDGTFDEPDFIQFKEFLQDVLKYYDNEKFIYFLGDKHMYLSEAVSPDKAHKIHQFVIENAEKIIDNGKKRRRLEEELKNLEGNIFGEN